MAEHTPDDFAETSPEEPDAEVSATKATPLQAEQSIEAKEEVLPTAGEAPQAEQSTEVMTAPTPENTLPPEAQGEANGGPLGCCLGIMIGLLLSLSLAVLSRFYAEPLAGVLQGNYGLLGLIVRILMGILAFVLAIFFGSIGWKLGKRFYREYEPPVRKRRARAKKKASKSIV